VVYDIDNSITCPEGTFGGIMIVLIVTHSISTLLVTISNFYTGEEGGCVGIKLFMGLPIYLYVFIHFLIADGCQEGMKVWIKADQLIFWSGFVNYIFSLVLTSIRLEKTKDESLL
jgi:hypothetical protein